METCSTLSMAQDRPMAHIKPKITRLSSSLFLCRFLLFHKSQISLLLANDFLFLVTLENSRLEFKLHLHGDLKCNTSTVFLCEKIDASVVSFDDFPANL